MFSLKKISALAGISADCKQRLGADIIIISSKITCRRLLNRGFLPWRQLSLKLISDRLRNLALDRKNVREVAVIGLPPKVRVVPGIDQLRIHSHVIRDTLHAPFQYIRDAKLLGDLAKVA